MYTGIVEYDPPRETPQTTSEFYRHPYGGIARDIYVTREGFARYWGYSVEYIDDLPVNSKVFDDMQPKVEILGYKIATRSGQRIVSSTREYDNYVIQYKIVHIDHSARARLKFHQQEMRKLTSSMELMNQAFGKATHAFYNVQPYLKGA